jgi:hypothetical protein
MLVKVGSSRNHSLGFSVSCSRYYDGAQIIEVDMTRAETPTAHRPAVLFKMVMLSKRKGRGPDKRSTHRRLEPESLSTMRYLMLPPSPETSFMDTVLSEDHGQS